MPPPENEPHKRKRNLDDGGQPTHLHLHQATINHQPEPSGRRLSVPVMAPGSQPYINFLPRHQYAQLLGLLPGELDAFNNMIHLINAYEGVLDRSESLAASLGARLTGPRFLRGIERFFDGPIKVNSPHPLMHSITWLDVVTFAKANPDAFSPVILPDGARCRQFMYNGLQVEIAEDDWRLIYSGALDKFPLEHIFQEDEAAELATLEIMLQRSSFLYKKADELAARARFLSRRLETRRKDVAHQLLRHADASVANAVTVSSGFCAINHPPRSGPGGCGSPHDLHADLLQQFMVASMQHQPPQGPSPGYYHHQQHPVFGSALPAIATGLSPLAAPILGAPPSCYQPLPVLTYPNAPGPAGTTASPSPSPYPSPSPSSLASILAPLPVLAPSPTTSVPASSAAAPVSVVSFPASNSLPAAPAPTPVPIPALPLRRARGRAPRGRGGRRGAAGKDQPPEKYRALVLKKTDTVNKGDVIFPTCDRCRRLRLQCVKHLSACRGCTRKHARCSWRNVTDEEAEIVRHQLEIIEREAQKMREEAAAAAAAAQAQASNSNSNSHGSGSGSASISSPGESSGAAADSTSQVELASRPASASASALAAVAAAASSAMASSSLEAPATIEPPLRLVPTSRLTRIDPAPPSVQRNPPRTGHLSAILSPPDLDDYEPRAYHFH